MENYPFEPMNEEELRQILDAACQNPGLYFQIVLEAPYAHIFINRDTAEPVDYDAITATIHQSLAPLQLPDVRILALYSRSMGSVDPDWERTVELFASDRPPSEDTTAAGSPDATPASDGSEAKIAASTLETEAAAPATATGPEVEPGPLNLSEYCFIRNKLLLKAKLKAIPGKLARTIVDFHEFADDRKKLALPQVEAYFDEEAQPQTEALAPELQTWFATLAEFTAEDKRRFGIWLSRYCFDPVTSLKELTEILEAEAAQAAAIKAFEAEEAAAEEEKPQTEPARRKTPAPQPPKPGGSSSARARTTPDRKRPAAPASSSRQAPVPPTAPPVPTALRLPRVALAAVSAFAVVVGFLLMGLVKTGGLIGVVPGMTIGFFGGLRAAYGSIYSLAPSVGVATGGAFLLPAAIRLGYSFGWLAGTVLGLSFGGLTCYGFGEKRSRDLRGLIRGTASWGGLISAATIALSLSFGALLNDLSAGPVSLCGEKPSEIADRKFPGLNLDSGRKVAYEYCRVSEQIAGGIQPFQKLAARAERAPAIVVDTPAAREEMTAACARAAARVPGALETAEWAGSREDDVEDTGELFAEVAPQLYAVDLKSVVPAENSSQPPTVRVLCVMHASPAGEWVVAGAQSVPIDWLGDLQPSLLDDPFN